AKEIRDITRVPLMVTGGFRTTDGMNAALARGETDMIGIARPACIDPDYATKVLQGNAVSNVVEDMNFRLGPTRFLGPHSPIGIVRSLNAIGKQSWNYAQIFAMADGLDVDHDLGLLKALKIYTENEKKQTTAINRANPIASDT
ncbi:MAG: hypothetical protein KDH94_09050, partial [Coxiellaceae bacterium]|nr:hypothetical protein [Coxiellaceae bacterium]